MNRYLLFLILSTGFIFKCYAHNTREAYFIISMNATEITIEAEFPWSIRKSVFEFNPDLEGTREKDKLDNAFFEYIKSNMILKDRRGKLIPLLNVAEGKKYGHSHQTNYTFKFGKGDLYKIKNTIMFNVSNDQINFHKVKSKKSIKNFKTTVKSPSFDLD